MNDDNSSARSLDLTACAPLAPELAEICAAIASDIGMVVNSSGVIQAVSTNGTMTELASNWQGQSWADTVTAETRPKIEQLLSEAAAHGHSRRREVNLRRANGGDLAVKYSAIRLGASDTFLVAGNDLSQASAIQQKFIERQRAFERDYWQQRKLEARYRLLFQTATDAVMVVDASNFVILEANQASSELFDIELDLLIGQDVADGVMKLYRPAVHELLVTARASGQPAEIRVPLARNVDSIELSATPLRGPEGMQLLLRARACSNDERLNDPHRHLIDYLEKSPDAVVITDSIGRVILGNPAFHGLVGVEHSAPVSQQPLFELLGCQADQLAAIIADVRSHGLVTQQSVVAQCDGGPERVFRCTVTLLDEDDQATLGFSIRADSAHASQSPARVQDLADQLTLLGTEIGMQRLPTLIDEATKLVEDFLVAQALEQSDGDLPTAAGLLKISTNDLTAIQDAKRSSRGD